MMLKTLLKKQLLELNRNFFYDPKKNTARSRASSILMIVLYALLMVGVIGGMFAFMATSLCRPLVEMGMGWLYYALIILIAVFLGVFGSVFNTYSSLYKAKDNDLLLSLPVPVRDILVARLTGVYLMGLMFSAVVMVPAVVVYLTVAPGVGAVIGGVVLTLLVSVFVLELSCILGWAVAKISARIRHKSIITVLLSVGFLAAYFYIYSNAYQLLGSIMTNVDQLGRSIRGWGYPLYLMGRGAMGEAVPLLVVLAVVGLLLAVIRRVLSHSFLKMAAASDETVKVKYQEKAVRIRSVRRALLGREAGRYLASPTYMLNCSLGTLFLTIMAVLALVKGRDVFLMLGTVLAGDKDLMAVLAALLLCMMASMNDITAPSVSLEGKSLWIAQSLPVKPWHVLRAKLELHLLLTEPPLLLCAVCVAAVSGVRLPEAVLLVVTPMVFTVLTAALGLFLNLKRPNLTWSNETAPVKQSLSVLVALLGGWALAIGLGAVYYALMDRVSGVVFLLAAIVLMLAAALALLHWLRTSGAKLYAQL